ncbi:tRNA-splicing endonuclease subunit Sen2-1-like protein isoform X1 [Tanacetum coccineum]
MDNSKRGHIPMQERLDLNKTQGASTPKEVKRMKNIPYASVVGSIMYVVRCTRPDVAFVQNITSRFQQNPGELSGCSELRVDCYCNAGFEIDIDDTKSLTGYVFILNGSAMGARHYHKSNLLKVHTDNNLAYPFTNALPKGKLTQHARSMGLRLAGSFITKILGGDDSIKTYNELWDYMTSKNESFPDFFKAYYHLRDKNLVVRSGDQYGVDFVAYRHNPSLVHSEYGVLVLREGNANGNMNGNDRLRVWSDVQCTLRLLGSVAKTLLILHVNRNGANLIGSSPSCLDGYSVEERTITRWSPERRREDQALKSTRWSPKPPREDQALKTK